MSHEITPAPFEAYSSSLGLVLDHGDDGTIYRISTPSGQVIGIRAKTTPSAANVEADIANPPASPVAPRSQSARTVLSRLTDTEYTALHTSSHIGIQRGLEAARIEGLISESDPDFPAFRAGCDALGIIASSRWHDLLAP
jgi:hypothetical protein